MRALLGALCLLTLVSCGGGGAGSGSGAAISDVRRAAVIQSVNDRFEQILAAGGTVDSQNLAIANAMAALPEFEAAQADPEFNCAWGRFTDGRLLIVGNTGFPAGLSPSGPGPMPKATFIAKPSKARLGHMFGANFPQLQDPINDMARYLQVDGSYQIQSPPEGKLRLSDYRAFSGDGFVYINSHGGEGETKSGQKVFVMVSSTPHDAATDALPEVQLDWNNDRLTYYTGLNGSTINGVKQVSTWYAINEKFIRAHMSFGPNAIVLLNVCFTGNSHVDMARFRDAFHSKGAGAVVGWTELCQSSSAFTAAKYFVDRLVAKNEFQKENPEQRAFSVVEVLKDMGRKGLNKGVNSELKAFYRSGVTNVGLRPTLRVMLRDELNDYLVLHGEFGSETGVVKVNNVPATLVGGWSNSVLVTRIPEKGPGSDGPVVVEVNGKKSKERYLTSWRGTYTFSYTDSDPLSTLFETGTAKIHIRMDVDGTRETAGGSLLDSEPRVFYAAGDSTLAWSCGGEARDNAGVHTRWSGAGSPPMVRTTITGPQNAWVCLGGYDPVTRQLSFALTNGGPKTVFHRGAPSTKELPLGSAAYSKKLNADWSGPADDQSGGGTVRKFSALTVTWPPPNGFRRPAQ